MRPEQITRLVEIEEQLLDVFVSECKPKKWPGMTKSEDRGDRYWHKKNALATLTIVGRIQTVLRDARTDGGQGEAPKAGDDPDLDGTDDKSIEREAADLERRGVAILNRHRRATKRKA